MNRRCGLGLLALALAGGCVEEGPLELPEPVAASVTVSPTSATLWRAGATLRLAATVLDQNGEAMPGAAVTWSSGNTSVASVSPSGLVTAAAAGTAEVTAEVRGSGLSPTADFTADCNGLACTFTSTSTDDTGIDSYLWSTGDGSAAGTTAVHEHTYGSAGTYTVTLVVRDGHGGLAAALYQIQVGDP